LRDGDCASRFGRLTVRTLGSGLGELAARAGFVALLGVLGCGSESPEAPPRGVGQVRVATVVDIAGPGTAVTTIDASFQRPDTRTQCQIATHGGCQVMNCVESTRPRPEAGELTLEADDGNFTQVLLPDVSGAYSFGDETRLFEPLDPVLVRFAGAEVPGFDVSGVFPEPLVVTEPVVPSGSEPYRVARGADLTFRWTGGVSGTTFSLSQGPLSATLLRCTVPSERGSLTVPGSALLALEEGPLDLRTVTPVWVSAGSYDVVLVLTAAALNADGQGISLTLEP
jgi:hypothetical protein